MLRNRAKSRVIDVQMSDRLVGHPNSDLWMDIGTRFTKIAMDLAIRQC